MWNLAVPWWELIVRSAVIYFALIVALRLFGKRQIGRAARENVPRSLPSLVPSCYAIAIRSESGTRLVCVI